MATMIEPVEHPDVTPRAELAEALLNLSHSAQREIPKVGNEALPTPWDRRHEAINRLLDEFEAAPA